MLILIIGILAAILIPSISKYIDKAKKSTALAEAREVQKVYDLWLIERNDLDHDVKGQVD